MLTEDENEDSEKRDQRKKSKVVSKFPFPTLRLTLSFLLVHTLSFSLSYLVENPIG